MKKFLCFLLVIFIIFIPGCSKQAQLEKAYQEQDIDQLIQLGQELAKSEPHNTDVHFYLGQAYEMKNMLEEALKEYDRVIVLNRHYAKLNKDGKDVRQLIQEVHERIELEKHRVAEEKYQNDLKDLEKIPVEKAKARELWQAYVKVFNYELQPELLKRAIYQLSELGEVGLAYDLYSRFGQAESIKEKLFLYGHDKYFAQQAQKTAHIKTRKVVTGSLDNGRTAMLWLPNDAGFLCMLDRGSNEDNILIAHYNFKNGIGRIIYKGNWWPEFASFKILSTGKILYQDNHKIIIFNQDNYLVEKEVNLPDNVKSADVTFDGKKIAYTTVDKDMGLWVSDIELKMPVKILASEGKDVEVKLPGRSRWNFNGNMLAYIDCRWEWTEGVGLVKADGSGEKYLAEISGAYNPVWFPDGNKIVVSIMNNGDMGPSKAYVLDIEKGTTRPVNYGKDANYAVVSPSGKEIAYLSYAGLGNTLWIEDIPSGKQSLVGGHIGVQDFTWSPDGKKILFTVKVSQDSPMTFWVSENI